MFGDCGVGADGAETGGIGKEDRGCGQGLIFQRGFCCCVWCIAQDLMFLKSGFGYRELLCR